MPALADGPFAGTWTATELRITNNITSWGTDCGRRPPTSYTEPGGSVTISQSGDHLTFSGAVRGATTRCWSDRPNLRRTSSRYEQEAKRWTVSCRTPPDDSQPETGRYSFRAQGDSTIVFEDRTEWDWRLNASHCVASRVARRTFTRVGAAPVSMDPDPPPEMQEAPCTAGAPARLRISPASETIEPGERVCFRTRVVDAAGCTVPGQSVQLDLAEAAGREASINARCFVAGANAASAEGEFQVVARSGDLRGTARVLVQTEDLSDLTAATRERAARMEGLSSAEAEHASGLTARALQGEGGLAWALGGGFAALLLIGAAIFLVVRRRRDSHVAPAPEHPPRGDTPVVPAPAPTGPVGATAKPPKKICPACGLEDETGDAYCPKDGATLLDPRDPVVRSQGMICPTCRRGHPADADVCAHDGDTLIPYPLFAARDRQSAVAVKKVCPTCGETYDEQTTFCGKDGTTLEIVN